MTIPEWLPEPPEPTTERGNVRYPWILGHERQADGTVHVQFALPGLRTATLTVPEAAWLAGEHLHAGRALMALSAGQSPRRPAR